MDAEEVGPWRADDDHLPVPLARPGLRFRRQELVIAAGATLPYDEERWRDAMVVVERGEIDLCCSRGGRRRFVAGAVLFFDGLGLRALHNPGLEDTVLVSLSRRRQA
jgi:hypothetical protein